MLSGLVCKLALICAFPISLLGQSTADVIQARLVGKPLYLRGLWKEDKLHFDSRGKLRGNSQTLPFTLSGIDITKVDLEPKGLVLEGQRVGIKFERSAPQRVPLLENSKWHDHEEQMHVEIDAPPGADYTSALEAIFTGDLADFIPSLPIAWQNYANKNLQPNSPPSSPATEQPPSPPGVRRVGGGVSPPRRISGAEPKYNDYALATKITGTCYIFMVVDEKGKPSQFSIVRPLGIGLDEQALIAVQQYVFEPAMEGGKPVPAAINVAVNFATF